MGSVKLRIEPTVRQAQPILDRVAAALERRRVQVERGDNGEVHFRVPPFRAHWRPNALTPLRAGRVWLGAGWGEPWRVRYELHYKSIQVIGLLASAGIVLAEWGQPRLALLNALAVFWGGIYLLIYLAVLRFRRLVTRHARQVVEGGIDRGRSAAQGPAPADPRADRSTVARPPSPSTDPSVDQHPV
jgi:hypothetical protein